MLIHSHRFLNIVFAQNIAKAGIAKGEFGDNRPENYAYGN